MNRTPRLISCLAIVLLTLFLGSGTPTLWAQQEQQKPAEPAPPEQRDTQNAPITPADENTPAATAEEAVVDDSPFDYQSTEKISEDLSVSFPVDI